MIRIIGTAFGAIAFIFLTGCNSGHGLGLNEDASIGAMDELPENPLLLHAITIRIQPRDSVMATLYGNEAAFDYAGHHGDAHYPGGAVLYEINWRQQPDPQWVGGNIPKKILSVERVAFATDGRPVYTKYSGTPLREDKGLQQDSARVITLAGQRMAVAP